MSGEGARFTVPLLGREADGTGKRENYGRLSYERSISSTANVFASARSTGGKSDKRMRGKCSKLDATSNTRTSDASKAQSGRKYRKLPIYISSSFPGYLAPDIIVNTPINI